MALIHIAVVWWNFSWRNTTHMSSPQIGHSWQTKLWIPPKSNLEQMNFIGVTYGNMGEGFQEQKWLKTAASPRPTWTWATAHKAGNLEPSAQPAGAQQAGECPLQVVHSSTGFFCLVSAFLLKDTSCGTAFFHLRATLGFYCLFWLGNLISFRDFLKLSSVNIPAQNYIMKCLNSKRLSYNSNPLSFINCLVFKCLPVYTVSPPWSLVFTFCFSPRPSHPVWFSHSVPLHKLCCCTLPIT